MAKKKVTHHPHHHPKDPNKEEEVPPLAATVPPEHMEEQQQDLDQDHSKEKLQSLKSLNDLLLKETVGRRRQVESLELDKASLEARLARSGDEKRSLEDELTRAGYRNVEMELERAVVCVFLETQMSQMAAEFGKLENRREGELRGLREKVWELNANLERERAVLAEVIRERDLARSECGSWIEKVNEMRENLNEIEKARGVLEQGFRKLEGERERLVRENREGEKVLEGARREKDSVERELAQAAEEIGQLKKKLEGLVRENKDMEMEKSGQKVKIAELEREVGGLNEVVAGLRKEEQRLRSEVFELGKICDDAKEKEQEMVREIETLSRDKKKKEATVEALTGERDSLQKELKIAEKELEDKERLMLEIIRKKTEIEEENICKQGEIAGLAKEVAELRDAVSALKLSCRDEKEKSEALLSEVASQKEAMDGLLLERDCAWKELVEERENAKSLRSKIVELERKTEETMGELKKITSDHENLLVQKKAAENRFEILRREKEFLEKRLSDSQQRAEELQAEIELAGIKSERALTFLKNTAASFLSKGESVDEPKVEEDVQPYVREMEAIKNAFQLKESVVEDLKRQLEFLQDSVAKAEKKKGFWTLLSSATTLFAAASVAYLARAR
ncbi:trichohyalin-like [Punica granatum]|uniref:Trichohyalin-like n=1 Tax=Punica granatum TaxID=22663 RepID=A0A218VSB6_PUNGR|nr:trichohyalin-like [Punica granatum]OWM62970.1 hypothetical protein CDL15_Pgr020264 [Punica granatum]